MGNKCEMIAMESAASYWKPLYNVLEDIEGAMSPLQKKMMKELLKHINGLDGHVKELDQDIDTNMGGGYKPAIEALDKIPGIGKDGAKAILAAIGIEMGRFPDEGHLCSWAGLCPGNNESAKKRKSGITTKGNALLKTILINCAHAAVGVKGSYFSAQFTRISSHRGNKRAYVAAAHSMLTAIYHVLKEKFPYKDLGCDYYNQFNRERKINAYLKKLKKLGWVPNSQTQVATA